MRTTVQLRDGEQVNVICMGRGEPVMLLHAFASQAEHWLPNVLPLTNRFRFYLPDLRGFAGSHHASLAGRDVFATYAHDIEDILNHFALQNVILGGISTGAYACLTYNQLYGFSRISKYVNIEHGANSLHSTGKTNGIFRERQDEYFAGFNELIKINEHQQHLGYWELPAHHRIQLRDEVAAALRRAPNKACYRRGITACARMAEPFLTRKFFPVERWPTYLKIMEAFMIGRDTRSSLADIRIPTMIMMGRQSRFFSLESQYELVESIPDAKAVIFENAGHAIMLDQPLHFQKTFARFLQS